MDEQRLDGVVRFGNQLVVVIESKMVGAAASEQAKQLRLRGVEVGIDESRPLAGTSCWPTGGRCWSATSSRRRSGCLMDDLVAMAEEHFPNLLPFTTLARAGDHELRLQRRLAALLREATGIAEINGELRPRVGAFAMLDGAKSTQRVSVQRNDGAVALYLAGRAEAAGARPLQERARRPVASAHGLRRAAPGELGRIRIWRISGRER